MKLRATNNKRKFGGHKSRNATKQNASGRVFWFMSKTGCLNILLSHLMIVCRRKQSITDSITVIFSLHIF